MKKRLVKILTGCLIFGNIYGVSLLSVSAEDAESPTGELAFAQCQEYVNIRQSASTNSEITAKIYNNGAVNILGQKDGWYQIVSGNAVGYIKKNYLATGKKAREIAQKTGYRVAEIYPEELYIRQEANQNSKIIGTAYRNEQLEVTDYNGGAWVKIITEDHCNGYINAEYAACKTYYPTAITLEEEKEMKAQANSPYMNDNETEDLTVSQNPVTETETETNAPEPETNTPETDAPEPETNTPETDAPETETNAPETETDAQDSQVGQQIADFAVQFVGNPYVWGGTSLTDGADCSGFTMSVMANFGIYIARTAADQSYGGVQINLDAISPGDLLFYSSSGEIDHVGLYIGGGQIVHASTSESGIRISSAWYSTPLCAVRYW